MAPVTPLWQGATVGQPPLAGHVNQLLVGHTSTWVYSGSALQDSQATGTAVYATTASQYLAQTFLTGAAQTTVGLVNLQVSTVGGSPITATITPLTVSLYASSSGFPTGAPLATTQLAEQAVYSAPFWLPVTLNATGLTPSTVYQLVVSPAGTGTAYYAWQHSNQSGNASTSPDGVTWTAQTYGLMYRVYDLSGVTGPPLYLIDDSGARVTSLTYDTLGHLITVTEQTDTQGGGSFFSTRTLTYSGDTLTGVT